MFKTLIFTDERKETLGKYCHLMELSDGTCEIFGGSFPMIFNAYAEIEYFKKSYSNLDLTGIKMIEIIVIEKEKLQELQDHYNQESNKIRKDNYRKGFYLGMCRVYENVKNEK